MIRVLVSVYDVRTGIFFPPMSFVNLGEATRTFTELSNDKGTNVGKYPTEFCFYDFGTWDDVTGIITQHPQPVSLGLATQYLSEKNRLIKNEHELTD